LRYNNVINSAEEANAAQTPVKHCFPSWSLQNEAMTRFTPYLLPVSCSRTIKNKMSFGVRPNYPKSWPSGLAVNACTRDQEITRE
jgi:hypothetical protein